MMVSPARSGPWSFLGMLLLAFPVLGEEMHTRESDRVSPVVVTLRSGATGMGRHVLIQHVATLSGGTDALRKKIGALDLAEVPPRGQTRTLVQKLLSYRIQLAGITRESFCVEGAEHVVVSSAAGPVTEAEFFAVASRALMDQIPYRADNVSLALSQSLRLPAVVLGAKDEVRFDAVPRNVANVPGRAQVDVALWVNSERVAVVPVLLDVKLVQEVAIAERKIESGEELTEGNVRLERRPIDAAHSFLTARDLASGKRARQGIASGQAILHSAVEPLNPDNPILVKRRDAVHLMARVGNLRVVTRGEAMQDGREGDRIPVRNVDSRKVITGRVVQRGLVEIEY